MITSQVTRTLEAKAKQAMAADTAAPRFDPTRRPSLVESDLAGRPGRRRLLLPAAALILALVGAAVVVARGGSNEADVRTLTFGDPPDGWLVPSWVPEGMDVWGIEWSWDSVPARGTDPDLMPQLFGDPDGGQAIYLTTSRYEVRADTTEQVTVRGQAGVAGLAWDIEEKDLGDAIRWDERGVDITALYKGMTRDEAVAALDSFDWRSDDPLDGFTPPSDGSLPLRAEVDSQQLGGRDISLTYSEGVPASDASESGLRVHTSSSSAISIDYLERWYRQPSDAGEGEQPITTYNPDIHELRVVWPDGRSIYISPTADSQSQRPSRATLERIADSLSVANEADLAALRDQADARIQTVPVVASAATSIGTVEVHGERRFLQLCLRGTGCRTDGFGGADFADGTALATAEWTIDGSWYIAVASKGDHPEIVGGRDRTSAPGVGPLPFETTTAGDWTIRLVQPAPDIEMVCTTDGSGGSCDHHRPA